LHQPRTKSADTRIRPRLRLHARPMHCYPNRWNKDYRQGCMLTSCLPCRPHHRVVILRSVSCLHVLRWVTLVSDLVWDLCFATVACARRGMCSFSGGFADHHGSVVFLHNCFPNMDILAKAGLWRPRTASCLLYCHGSLCHLIWRTATWDYGASRRASYCSGTLWALRLACVALLTVS
jgi:hypothetical protein